MNTTRLTQRPWTALAAFAATLLVATQGASAAEPASARVDVVGQLALRDACPAGDAALADSLAGAWDDAAKPSTVEVTFELRRQRVYDVAPRTDSARVFHQIRRAVRGLQCDGGDDATHTVRFIVRFADRVQVERVAMAAAPSPR